MHGVLPRCATGKMKSPAVSRGTPFFMLPHQSRCKNPLSAELQTELFIVLT